MLALLTTIHVLVAVILILIVLLQSARGTDIAGAFGGMGSQAAFGPRGTATFLSKATVALAGIFMVTSLSLAILANRSQRGGESILSGQEAAAPQGQTTPAPTTPTPTTVPGAPGVQVQGGELPFGGKVTVGVPDQPPASGATNPPAGSEQTTPPPAPAQTPQPPGPAAPGPNP